MVREKLVTGERKSFCQRLYWQGLQTEPQHTGTADRLFPSSSTALDAKYGD